MELQRCDWETPSQFACRAFVVRLDASRTETLSFVWANKYFRNTKYPAETEARIAAWQTPAQVRALMAADTGASAAYSARPAASAPSLPIPPPTLPPPPPPPPPPPAFETHSLSTDAIVEWDDAYTYARGGAAADGDGEFEESSAVAPVLQLAHSSARSALYDDGASASASQDAGGSASIQSLAISLSALMSAAVPHASAHAFHKSATPFSSTESAAHAAAAVSTNAEPLSATPLARTPLVDRTAVPTLIALPSAGALTPQTMAAAAAAAAAAASASSSAPTAQISAHLQSRHRDLADTAVARDTLTSNEMQYDRESFSFRVMSALGWQPGQALGRSRGLGLTDGAVLPSQLAFLYDSPYGQRGPNERAGLGSYFDWFTKPAVNRVSIHQQLADFFFNSVQEQCMFTNALSKDERALVHDLADEYGLAHKSYGKGAERYLVVSKRARQVRQLSGGGGSASGDADAAADAEERERQDAIRALQAAYERSNRRRTPRSALSAVPPPAVLLRDTVRASGVGAGPAPMPAAPRHLQHQAQPFRGGGGHHQARYVAVPAAALVGASGSGRGGGRGGGRSAAGQAQAPPPPKQTMHAIAAPSVIAAPGTGGGAYAALALARAGGASAEDADGDDDGDDDAAQPADSAASGAKPRGKRNNRRRRAGGGGGGAAAAAQ